MRTRTYTYTWCKVHVPTRVVIESTCKQCVDTHTYMYIRTAYTRSGRRAPTRHYKCALHRRPHVRTRVHALCVRCADSSICTLHHVCVRTCVGVGLRLSPPPFFFRREGMARAPPRPHLNTPLADNSFRLQSSEFNEAYNNDQPQEPRHVGSKRQHHRGNLAWIANNHSNYSQNQWALNTNLDTIIKWSM